MAIPGLTKEGVLPPGIHDCALSEVETVFAKSSKRRQDLWEAFQKYTALIKPIGIFDVAYIDGSFVTNKPNPSDIDLVLEVPGIPMILPLLSRRELQRAWVKETYDLDVFPWFPGLASDFRDFFQKFKPADAISRGLKPGANKGILKVHL